MIINSLILATVIFIMDFLIYGQAFIKPAKKTTTKQFAVLKKQLEANIPFSIMIQFFYSLVLINLFIFLVAFKIFETNLSGSFSYALIIYLPMLYLIINSWLWGNKEHRHQLAPTIYSWLAKFICTGVVLGLLL